MNTPGMPVVLDSTTAAYVAGIIDGEGTLGAAISGNRPWFCYRPIMMAVNTSATLMDWLAENLGGNGWALWRQPKGNAKRIATWCFSRRQIEVVLPQVRPFLVIKAKQGDLVIEMLRLARQERTAERQVAMRAIYDRCRALNKKGRNPCL